ncbi:MAG: protein kinase [Candidatus Aminicenantes bacterium]|nr:MAG: protein kinase [Candidatus Aminicenantes bacterium]
MKCANCQADNPENAHFCWNCGTQLKEPTPPPETPKGDEEATRPLPTPIRELRRGAVFAKRYEIIEELGRGGMGRLYRVLDTKISQEVALKILRPEISRDQQTIGRFSNELRLARQVAHKNVCRMYHLGEAEGTHFIIMEYIPGQDLQSMIKMTKQLSMETAVSIAKQICEGLAEAHRLGVIHRDLKPGNIMIDREGNARILDFGIARSLESKGLTKSGLLIGTPEYMSPEQAQDTGVDQRSDIYSLGVILYEMVTGKVPFTGETPISITIKHIEEMPKSPKTLAPQIPDILNQLIMKCLAKNKEFRPKQVGEILSGLTEIEASIKDTKKIPKMRKSISLKEFPRPFGFPAFFFPLLVLILAVALVLIIWKPWSREDAAPVPTDKPSLAILYFKNNTGDATLNHWRTALSDLLITDLSQSQYLRVLSAENMFDILNQLNQLDTQTYSSDVLRDLARRGGVENVLVGNYTRAGDMFRINTTLQDAQLGELIGSEMVQGTGEQSFYSMVDELTRRIKENFQIPDEVIAADIDEQVGQITTSSPEALRHFTEGTEYIRQADYGNALESLDRAIEIDAEFAMAYEAIATAYNNLGYTSEAKEYFEKAFEFSDRVSERELYQIQGEYYRSTEETFDKAIEAYERLLVLYPEDGDANNRLGLIYKSIEEWDKAIERYEVCIQNRYDRFFFYVNAAEVFMAKGMYERAGHILELYLDEFDESAWIHGSYAVNYLCQRQYEFAHIEADRALAVDPTHFHAHWIKGDIYHAQEDFFHAEAEYQKLPREAEEVARLYGWDCLGDLYMLQGRWDEAIVQILQAFKLAESVGDRPWQAWLSSRLAYMYMRQGNYQEALDVCNNALQIDMGGARLDLQRRVMYFKGLAEVAMNSLPEARKTATALRQSIEGGLNQKEIRFFYHLAGMIQLAIDRYPQAIENFNQAISLLPHQYYRHPWIVGNDRAMFLDSLALAYARSGNQDEALEEYGKIHTLTLARLDYGDIYAKSYYQLAKIFEQKGWDQLAKQNYQRFLSLWQNADPGIPELDDARQRLTTLQ